MVRTRFAPSPTGKMHVGNLRTALFEYLVAKHNGGTFVLRIEDTDRRRYVEGAVDIIYDTLRAVGITHDEGPDVGGGYEPYVQSERLENYIEYAERLVADGKAYYCFCSKSEDRHGRADAARDDEDPHAETSPVQEKYDRRCLSLPKDEIERRIKNGEPRVIRQLIPEGSATFTDEVYGTITVSNDELEDQILIKSDGYPTYNFANVIDDHLMDITHVVRGSEFLASTPKYALLYAAFGWEPPAFIHLPLILAEGGGKMGKRKGSMSFDALLEEGYLPEAVINYIALLGWSPPDNREIFTVRELVAAFDLKHISKSPSTFDFTKLAWMNGEYIKKMPDDAFFESALPYLNEAITTPGVDLNKVAAMTKTRVNFLKEIPGLVDFIDATPDYDAELFVHKKMKTDRENSQAFLKEAAALFKRMTEWDERTLYVECMGLVARLGIKNGQLFWPVRTALSGKPSSPCGATELAALLGKDESIKRIETGIRKLADG